MVVRLLVVHTPSGGRAPFSGSRAPGNKLKEANVLRRDVSTSIAVVSGPVVVPVAHERRIGPSGGHGGFRCR